MLLFETVKNLIFWIVTRASTRDFTVIWKFQKLWPCCAGPTRLLFLGRNMNIICRYTCSNSNMTDHFGSYFYVINYIFTSVDRQIMFCEVTFNLTQISDAFLHFSGWNIFKKLKLILIHTGISCCIKKEQIVIECKIIVHIF